MPDSNPFAHFIRLGQSVKKASQLPCCFVEPMSSSAPAVSVALWIACLALAFLAWPPHKRSDHKRLLHSTECSLNSLWVLGFSQAELLHQPSDAALVFCKQGTCSGASSGRFNGLSASGKCCHHYSCQTKARPLVLSMKPWTS
ncbi:hypothetical protein WJX77_001153 [Trebouxia sp. C0004]